MFSGPSRSQKERPDEFIVWLADTSPARLQMKSGQLPAEASSHPGQSGSLGPMSPRSVVGGCGYLDEMHEDETGNAADPPGTFQGASLQIPLRPQSQLTPPMDPRRTVFPARKKPY